MRRSTSPTGSPAATSSAAPMPRPAASPAMPRRGRTTRVNAATGDFYRNTRATLEGAWLRPRHDGYMAFQQAASDRINEGLDRDGIDGGSVVDDLNRLFRESFGENLWPECRGSVRRRTGSSAVARSAATYSSSPDPLGISRQQLRLLVGAGAGDQRMGGGDPGRQPAAQRADRPVAAPDDAVPAERADRVLDIGPQRFDRPVCRDRHRRRRPKSCRRRSAAWRSRSCARATDARHRP